MAVPHAFEPLEAARAFVENAELKGALSAPGSIAAVVDVAILID